ncbi:RING finger and transmembrane domain-containing protein 2 [Triticum urartu]|uniref:RING finger and transmembrane domain-containing protein 2 n=1 Tax=Triticum urartu TaxID=4572 RepID=M7ZHK9_TRIUA|nr:RING finger and transmembrane domain-containing protein 2 [Triticum urartu]
MTVKCMLLMYYKNSRGRNYRRQYWSSLRYHPLYWYFSRLVIPDIPGVQVGQELRVDESSRFETHRLIMTSLDYCWTSRHEEDHISIGEQPGEEHNSRGVDPGEEQNQRRESVVMLLATAGGGALVERLANACFGFYSMIALHGKANKHAIMMGQMLTLVEYLLLLYRALLPTPVWYRFFLNKEYGSLFSSLTTGLYLTFKLTSVVEKVQSFLSAVKALSRKDVHYGSYATAEQLGAKNLKTANVSVCWWNSLQAIAAGDMCAICQEKMHVPVLLRCKHIFCEDCVSEWFERERTCPLCRALVKPADIRSFGDGSTSLFFQLF